MTSTARKIIATIALTLALGGVATQADASARIQPPVDDKARFSARF